MERTEVLARMQDVNVAFQLDVDLPHAERWRPLIIVTGQEADYAKSIDAAEQDDANIAQEYLTWNRGNPSSIVSSVAAARENARTIRETISLEMWETVNDLWLWFMEKASRRLFEDDRNAFYKHIKNQCLLFHGIAEATMLHDEPFRFMRLGTTLERVGQTARILDVKHHSMGSREKGSIESPLEAAQWLATLRFCSAVEPFFKRDVETFSGRAVAWFLLFDRSFPRSVRCNLVRSKNLLKLIRGSQTNIGEGSLTKLEQTLAKLDAQGQEPAHLTNLHETFTWIVDTATHVCGLLDAEYFDPPAPSVAGGAAQA
jgi:uncharacterized alpha-E superfamily protein